MADDDGHDRRRAERIPINLEFAAMPSATYISDLSEYGVFVHTDEPAPMGTKLKLRFTVLLDDPVIITAEGWVVRHQHGPTGMGIEFTDLDPETILRINDAVSRQSPRDSGPPLERTEAEGSPAADDEDLDSASTLLRGKTFQPPPMAGTQPEVDETQKTGLFQAVPATATDDSE